MANNHEAEGSQGGRGHGVSKGADKRPVPVVWPRSLTVPLAYQVAAFDLHVPLSATFPEA
jgi:hypothetical protein